MVDTLYHYSNNSTLCSIVQSRSVWLSSTAHSNDAMEGKWIRRLVEEEFQKRGVTKQQLSDIIRQVDSLVTNCEGLVFCLSQQRDLLSQWRGYADDGRGVSIGFDFQYLTNGSQAESDLLNYLMQKVSYDGISNEDSVKNVIDSVAKLTGLGANTDYAVTGLMFDLFRFKNPAFQEEEEWRLVSLFYRNLSDTCLFRARGDTIVPYRALELIPCKHPIREVVLGPKYNSNERDVEKLLVSSLMIT